MRASVDLPEPDGPTMASRLSGLQLEADTPLSTGSLMPGGRYKQPVDGQAPLRFGQAQLRLLALQ